MKASDVEKQERETILRQSHLRIARLRLDYLEQSAADGTWSRAEHEEAVDKLIAAAAACGVKP